MNTWADHSSRNRHQWPHRKWLGAKQKPDTRKSQWHQVQSLKWVPMKTNGYTDWILVSATLKNYLGNQRLEYLLVTDPSGTKCLTAGDSCKHSLTHCIMYWTVNRLEKWNQYWNIDKSFTLFASTVYMCRVKTWIWVLVLTIKETLKSSLNSGDHVCPVNPNWYPVP